MNPIEAQDILPPTCPCCGYQDFRDLLAFPGVPFSGHFRQSATKQQTLMDLEFELCRQCGLVRQKSFSRPPDYAEVVRSTARQISPYVPSLIHALIAQGVKPDALILEVGSNDGAFLALLRKAGFVNLIGIEPSRALAQVACKNGFRIENDYFDSASAERLVRENGRPQVIICRHTLEHVPAPDAFVAALKDCVDPSGLVLLEVPDGAAIPELMNVYEFWDEHFYCFCAENLALLVNRYGLAVTEIKIVPHLDTRNLIAWLRPAPTDSAAASLSSRRNCPELWENFRVRWPLYRARVVAAMEAAPHPLYVIGASHSQSNFINFMGVGAIVDFMIDDDPVKVGRFAPISKGSPAIISTESFESMAKAGTLVKTGFGYSGWTARLCRHAEATGMTIVDPQVLQD